MSTILRTIVVSVAPCLIAAAVYLSYAALLAGIDQCDPKFGCVGGLQFASFWAAVAAVPSAIGFGMGAIASRGVIAMTSRWMHVLLLSILSIVHLSALFLVPRISIGTETLTAVMWVACTAVLAGAFARIAQRLGPDSGTPRARV